MEACCKWILKEPSCEDAWPLPLHLKNVLVALQPQRQEVHWSHQSPFFGSLKLGDGKQPEEMSTSSCDVNPLVRLWWWMEDRDIQYTWYRTASLWRGWSSFFQCYIWEHWGTGPGQEANGTTTEPRAHRNWGTELWVNVSSAAAEAKSCICLRISMINGHNPLYCLAMRIWQFLCITNVSSNCSCTSFTNQNICQGWWIK